MDFERGRVKPRFLVSLVAALPLAESDRLRVLLRGSLLNLFDRAYAYNFGNPFSGTHFGAPGLPPSRWRSQSADGTSASS